MCLVGGGGDGIVDNQQFAWSGGPRPLLTARQAIGSPSWLWEEVATCQADFAWPWSRWHGSGWGSGTGPLPWAFGVKGT